MAEVKAQLAVHTRFALRVSSFRMFMLGSLVSRIGDWMDFVALNWAVLQFTNSPLNLGLINACRLVPAFVLSVPAGILADRYDRRKLLIVLQGMIILFTCCLAYLTTAGSAFWLFAIVVTLRSMFTAMDPPVRNSLIANVVPDNCMASAIAINSASINLSRMIGPAFAGLLLMIVSIPALFWINACSTVAVLLSLAVLRPVYSSDRVSTGKMNGGLREAIAYVRQHSYVQSLLILSVVPMIFGFPYSSMMPLFARDLLGLGADGFGALLSVSAIGGLAGSVWLSSGREFRRPGRWLVFSIIGFGAALLFFVFSPGFVMAAAAMLLAGITSQVYRTLSRITLQMQVPDSLRGRLLSIALMDRGFIPLGAILIGMIAEWAGVLPAGVVMGAGCIGATIAVLILKRKIWYL